MRPHPNPIVVIGMQRSGTSALSAFYKKLGVFFGKPDLLYPPDANNPNGFFEHRKATLLNLRCLEAFQMHPTSFDHLQTDWKQHPQADSLRKELKSFIKDEFSTGARWGIKQPLTSLVMHFYNEVFAEMDIQPHYVLACEIPWRLCNPSQRSISAKHIG